MNNHIELSKKSKGISNWFTEEWVTNGFFAVRRYLIGNSDEHLMALGFEYRDGEDWEGRLRFIPESFDSIPIFDSGFKFQNLTLFFGKNSEMVCFETPYISELNVIRAEYSDITQTAKVYTNGDVSMLLKPFNASGTDVERQFPNHRLLPRIEKKVGGVAQ